VALKVKWTATINFTEGTRLSRHTQYQSVARSYSHRTCFDLSRRGWTRKTHKKAGGAEPSIKLARFTSSMQKAELDAKHTSDGAEGEAAAPPSPSLFKNGKPP